jgi:hypothetical protein
MLNRDSAWSALTPIVVAALLLSSPRPAAQQPTLTDVLARAGERATALAEGTRVLICEERYEQKYEKARALVGFEYSGPVGARNDVSYNGIDQREWAAEVALAATPRSTEAGFPWMEFRDVLTVNGKPHGAASSRLGMLVRDTSGAAVAQALEISQSSATLLFGRLMRAVDIPRTATLFLHPANQPRFEFRKGGQKRIDGVQAMEIRFEEKRKPTIVRASGDLDSPSKGSLWVDPATGNVLMSLLKSADSSTVYDELTVTYRVVAEVGTTLPAEVSERIMDEDAGARVLATTTFSNWHAVAKK